MSLHIPTATIDDLRKFHAKHFPDAPLPEHYLHGVEAEAAEEVYDYEDDGLGYYEDGVKRTLTDEQIAMFRHTEIQTILRERRRRRDEGELTDYEPAPAPEPTAQEASIKLEPAAPASPSSDEGTPMSISSDTDTVQSGRVEKPQQQWTKVSAKTKMQKARHRKNHRKNQLARKKEEKRMKRERKTEDSESDEWDPWHQANGPDVQKDDTVDLDY